MFDTFNYYRVRRKIRESLDMREKSENFVGRRKSGILKKKTCKSSRIFIRGTLNNDKG